MGRSQHDPAMQSRHAWNAGKTVGTKRPLTQKQIWAVRFLIAKGACATERCSIWRSTVSCAAVIL
jgi:hypothetical protein